MGNSRRIYRRATIEDKEKVLDILKDLYYGMDYLPYLYNDVVTKDDKRGYVCEEDGEIIGFSMVSIVDGGETVIRRAGRVKPEHQGKGVYGKLVKYLMDDCAAIPTVKDIAIAITDDHVHRIINLVRTSDYKRTYTANVIKYDFNMKDVGKFIKTETSCKNVIVDQINVERMEEIFTNPKLCDYYFPEGIVFSEFIPLKPITANIKNLINDSKYVVETKKKNYKIEESECSLLSIGSLYPCKKGLAYHIFINGKNTEDFALHFSRHLQNIATISQGVVSSMVSMASGTDNRLIKETFARYNIESQPIPFTNFQVYVGENILM